MTARLLPGGIDAVAGIRAGGHHAGIKIRKPDLALLYVEAPPTASVLPSSAAVFTQNLVAAAPVVVSRPRGRAGRARAAIVNSGCANACTGAEGLADARSMTDATAQALGLPPEAVVAASTGVIGQRLPMEKVLPGIKALVHEVGAGKSEVPFAEAILTTDLVRKEVLVECTVAGRTIRVGGAAKGSGMIHPNMATMLGFLATDAHVEPRALQVALEKACDSTFNMISVDGDTSTNDSVFLFATGAAGGLALTSSDEGFAAFQEALTLACKELAVAIARDGEGASTLIEIRVQGAASEADARAVARTISSSNLVKTAVAGRDPNWGRILAAAGRSGAAFDPSHSELIVGSLAGRARLVKNGAPCETLGREELKKILDRPEIVIILDLHEGNAEATAWGCDLTHGYVDINASYT